MTEPRYQVGTVSSTHPIAVYAGARYDIEIYDMHTDPAAPIATCDTPEEAQRVCDLLNAGEQARALAAAVERLQSFVVRRYIFGHEAELLEDRPPSVVSNDGAAAAIIALARAIKESEEGR